MSGIGPQRRTKSGAQVKHYESPDVVKNFDFIRIALQEQNPADASSYANKQLAQLTADLIKFMDLTLGRQVSARFFVTLQAFTLNCFVTVQSNTTERTAA